jgi:hypothetical protein
MGLDCQFHLRYPQMGGMGMPTLSELVQTVAIVEGMDPATVGLIARNVREAGLITTGGRGPSAGQMTLVDATNLLIAVNASDRIRDAAETVQKYGRLEAYGERSHTSYKLLDALRELIQATCNNALPAWYVLDPVPPQVAEAFSKEEASVSVQFDRPIPVVRVAIHAPRITDLGQISLGQSNVIRTARQLKRLRGIEYEFAPAITEAPLSFEGIGDRSQVTTISYPTIRAVAKLFVPEDSSSEAVRKRPWGPPRGAR